MSHKKKTCNIIILKSGIKNGTEVTLKLWSNIIGERNKANNFPTKFLLTNTQVSKLCRACANGSSANIKLRKTQFHKIGQSGGFLGRLSGPFLRTSLSLMKMYWKNKLKLFWYY